ncbi:39S ribosomal protein L55, mitochondrial isoform X1 [Zootermopsis nevadensis]|uniref:39S ribosomal protein L55, mitochondrial n=1 Tax=Zootermopsis nevadensis TaxID=136037 RepID=A0A067RHM1_ZOONE|nr:39S ribosomal protein L55, mitochondrial isoform X1 [Zootermopsis nevadensis]KDR22533.1 39S ribosomal protein L55, mitochondrial [Zootermopsis nevadensis]
MSLFSAHQDHVSWQVVLKEPARFVIRSLVHQPFRCLNSNTASITKVHRKIYARLYPTAVILPDGSSFGIRYHEPRKIIKLPLDLSTLSEAERIARLERRKPKKKVKIEEDIEDDFDARQYVHLLKQ